MYEHLAHQAYLDEGGYDRSSLVRYLMLQILPDCEAALQYLPPAGKRALAIYLAHPYKRLGLYRRALALYEQAIEIDQELGDRRGVAEGQSAIANIF